MDLFKKKITEQEAAMEFVMYVMKKSQKDWPNIHLELKNMFKGKFIVDNEEMPQYDLALAAIALNLQAVRNLFTKEQAERLEKWIIVCVNTKEYGEYSLREIKKYDEMFNKSVEDTTKESGPFKGTNPLDILSTCLLDKWLGPNFKNFEVEINGKKTGVIDPLLVLATTQTLITFAGTWKMIKEKFKLVEGDVPLEDENLDLKDYKPESSEEKPDGTVQYYDKNGNLKEKWLPLEQIRELLKKGNAKRVYKVLIKGPWDGIKETWWELSDDVIKRFVDEKDYAYATAHYEKGELKYYFVTKRLWERQEQMEKIVMDPNLSEEQQVEAIKKLASDLKQGSLFEED